MENIYSKETDTRKNYAKLFIGTVHQEDWAGMGIRYIHMADPVKFFVLPGVFVFFDDLVLIIVNGGTCHDPGLGTIPHDLLINVVTRELLADK